MKGLIFTLVLTYGGAVVSLFRPFYGLLIYICFAIIKPEALWFWSVPVGNYSRIIAIALLIGWAFSGFGRAKMGRGAASVWLLVAYWCWAIVSTVFSPEFAVGVDFLEANGKIVLPVVVGATLITNRKQIRQLAWTIVLSQGYAAYDLNMSYFSGFNRLQLVGMAGFDNNSYAIGLVTGVGIAFFLGLCCTKLWQRLLAFACAAFMTHAIFFSFSRGGMVALCVVGIVSFFLVPKKPTHYALFAFGLILAMVMAGAEVRERFSSVFLDEEERGGSAQSRVDMWGNCITLMMQNPLVGIGPNQFPNVVHTFGQYAKGKEAHTLWLQIGAELGIPGMLFLFGFFTLTSWRLLLLMWKMKRSAETDPVDFFIPRMVIASMAGYIVAAQFVSVESLEIPYYVALLGVGALKVNSTRASPQMDSVQHAAAPSYPQSAEAHHPRHEFGY